MDTEWPYRKMMTEQPSRAKRVTPGTYAQAARIGACVVVVTGCALLAGCVAQQADLVQPVQHLVRGLAGLRQVVGAEWAADAGHLP